MKVTLEYQAIPRSKIEDFGVCCKQYYALEVLHFKSSLDHQLLDLLWNKYWVNMLSSSSLLTDADFATSQALDLFEKTEQ
ncbi:unnamed protein product [Gulo gulo]|uniref:COP9 signalosome complex subunit 5 n=1 Tax=Gulo gulo TaxID=48420 RepID=A0A9X9M2L6_GULGU|nr:unnamed protein product [Gulo gulo]